VAIADPSLERASERARSFDIERVYASAEELMASGGIDAVGIAAPREVHAQLVQMAAARGLPVLYRSRSRQPMKRRVRSLPRCPARRA
jgi:predicted dehydrogenase